MKVIVLNEQGIRNETMLDAIQIDDLQLLQVRGVIDNGEEQKIPLSRLAAWGVGMKSALAAMQSVAQKQGGSGIYYVNTHGKQMFAAKSEAGFIGSLSDAAGKVGGGQANMIPLHVDPTMLCMAAVMANIDRKLDAIQEQQKEIMDFLSAQEESKIRGNIQTLADVLQGYQYNWENETYKVNKHNLVQQVRKEAEQEIILYRGLIQKSIAKQRFAGSNQMVQSTAQKILKNLQNYQLAVYQYAYAAFLEVLLLENFTGEYLSHVSEKIREHAFQYRKEYTNCYDYLECLSEKSLQTKMMQGLSNVSIGLGSALAKAPILKKGPVDESLIDAGQKLKKSAEQKTNKIVCGLIGSADSGTAVFTENIDKINRIWNKPKEVFFDDKAIYFVPKVC